MKLEDGQTLLLTGDSITDCTRRRPIATDWGFGDGYVCLVDSHIAVWRFQGI